MIHVAYKNAIKSEFSRHRLGAVIVRGGRVISTGFNSLRYTKELKHHTLHAEEAAILNLLKSRRQHLLIGSELYVCRVRPNGTTGLSRPCARCMELIHSVGISRVFYTTNENTVESLKL